MLVGSCIKQVPDTTQVKIAAAASSGPERLRDTLGAQVGLLDSLAGCLDPAVVVVKDSTISAYTWGNRLLPVLRPRTSIMPNSFAIGLGLPHAVGAAVGAQAPVVLLVGDGGFLLSATELATVAQEELPIVVIVFVDGGYGILRNIQEFQYGSEEGLIGVNLGRPDFCGLAASFGIRAERVRSVERIRGGNQARLSSSPNRAWWRWTSTRSAR